MMKRLILILALLTAAPTLATAAVAFDGEAVVSGNAGAASSITLSSKTTAGTNRVGVVMCGGQTFGASPYVTGATWNGVAMTNVRTDLHSGALLVVSMWYIVAPPTGASSVVISFPASSFYGGCGAASFNGVDQSTPLGTATTADLNAGAQVISTNVTLAAGDLAVDALVEYNIDPAVGAGQTGLFEEVNSFTFAAGSYEAGTGTVTMSHTWAGGGSDDAVIIAVPLKTVSAGGPTCTGGMLLRGVGGC
jgi:hypothetical protein